MTMPAMAAATKTEFSWAVPQRQAVGLDSIAEPTHHQNRQHHRNEERRGSAAKRTGLFNGMAGKEISSSWRCAARVPWPAAGGPGSSRGRRANRAAGAAPASPRG
jgi:hypothetical protein